VTPRCNRAAAMKPGIEWSFLVACGCAAQLHSGSTVELLATAIFKRHIFLTLSKTRPDRYRSFNRSERYPVHDTTGWKAG
jgi:hypothetical protein